ncbi:GyrI-like domain-containing protein [uncultured Alsobacter sp.]|uniref:GyrI-like domain-containing protein n=1 Tax=uncultured Alsobacter sp. TaxID=1748258 RepID=UPI0025CBA682|nr:GyrI-like domain-containing protein [uncultured Alsobacter sp.]
MARTCVRNPVWKRGPAIAAIVLGVGLTVAQAQTQTPAPAAPAPATPAPASPAPAAPVAPAPTVPAPVPPAAQGTPAPLTLTPAPADPSMPDEVVLSSRPALTVRGQSTWDDGYDVLIKAFDKLKTEAGKAGLQAAGVPLASFLETDDTGFKFEAQLPLAAAPAGRPGGLAPEIGVGKTPEGRAIRFVHRAPYDDIDSTYEAISAYLDAKGIEVKESFTEEYVNPGKDAGDTGMELFIYVQPK